MTAALPGHPAARAAPPARRGRLRHAVDLRARCSRSTTLESLWDFVGEYALPRRAHRPAAARRDPGPLRHDHRARLRRRLPDAPGVRGGLRARSSAATSRSSWPRAATTSSSRSRSRPPTTSDDRTAADMAELINRCVDGHLGLHVHRARLLRLLPAPALRQAHLPRAVPGAARRQRARLQPRVRRARDGGDRDGGRLGPRADPVRGPDRHQDPLRRDAGGRRGAHPHVPAPPRSRAPGDLDRLRAAAGAAQPGACAR